MAGARLSLRVHRQPIHILSHTHDSGSTFVSAARSHGACILFYHTGSFLRASQRHSLSKLHRSRTQLRRWSHCCQNKSPSGNGNGNYNSALPTCQRRPPFYQIWAFRHFLLLSKASVAGEQQEQPHPTSQGLPPYRSVACQYPTRVAGAPNIPFDFRLSSRLGPLRPLCPCKSIARTHSRVSHQPPTSQCK